MDLLEKGEKYCITNKLIEKGDRIVVGVSGGPDSLCLLSLLNSLKDKYELELIVVHINHSLREEADFEENYVKEMATKLNLKFFSKKVDINMLSKEKKCSTEEVARNVRYEFFREILVKTNANKIAVAHNKNDNAETVLMNIIRGSGNDGVSGIDNKKNEIIRPLICISRAEIEEYCNEKLLIPMIDKTNFETVYTRNKVRNLVIPMLKEINPDVIESLNRFSEIVRDEEEFIEEYVENIYSKIAKYDNKELYIEKNEFLKLKVGIKRRILRMAIYEFKNSLKDVSFKTINNAINEIEHSQNGNLIKIVPGVRILVEYNKLKFVKGNIEIKDYIYELNIPGRVYLKEIDKWITAEVKNAEDVAMTEKNPNIHFFDIAKTGKKLYVRNRKNGDYFYPTGMDGKRKIKDFFSDLKLERKERDEIPIITNGEEIVWIVGLRSSKKFLKDKSTKEVIIINYGENI